MSASSTKIPIDTESTQNDPLFMSNSTVPLVVENTVDAEDTPNAPPVATNTTAPRTVSPVMTNATTTENVP